MKKILAAAIALLILCISSVYVLIPKEIIVSHNVFVQSTDTWVLRCFTEKDRLIRWWPKEPESKGVSRNTDSVFTCNNQIFSIDSFYINAVAIKIKSNDNSVDSRIDIRAVTGDTAGIQWECKLIGSKNPFKRIQQYEQAVQTRKSMVDILTHLKTYLENRQNIYGVNVELGKIKDTLLLSMKSTFAIYPQSPEVYVLLKKLHDHIVQNGAKETGFPMLNITTLKDGTYAVQVAIPINKEVPQTNDFKIKKMIPGNALIAETRGGAYSIQRALEGLEQFKNDYSRSSPAIPFQSIITNRINEPDTAKWITKVYYPIW